MSTLGTPQKINIDLRTRASRNLFNTPNLGLASGDTTDEEDPDTLIQDTPMADPGTSGGVAPTSTSSHGVDAPHPAADFGTSAGGSYLWQSRSHHDGTGSRTPGAPKLVLPAEMCHICLLAAYDYQVHYILCY